MTAVASRFLATRYLGSSFSVFVHIAFAIINRLIPSLGPLAKWRSVFYWILIGTLDLDWLCPDLVIIDLYDRSCPPPLMAGKIGFLIHIPLTGISSPSSSLFFTIFIFLGTFTHQILRIRVLTLSCK